MPNEIIKVPNGITRTEKSALTEINNPISAFKSRVGKIKIINNEEHLNQGSTDKYKHLKK